MYHLFPPNFHLVSDDLPGIPILEVSDVLDDDYKKYEVVLSLPNVTFELTGNWKSSVTPKDSDDIIESESIYIQAESKVICSN